MSPPIFTEEALREAAERKAGASDYGSNSYRAALEPLLHSIAHEAELNEVGQREVWKRIVDALANRLTVVAWEAANPDLASAPVEPPLVILGLPRTGSSILHETLAAAPGMRTPLIWEVRDYTLAHSVQDARLDARVQQIEANIARKNELAPGYAAIHYEDAHVPMECLAMTVLDLVTSQFATIAWAPTYRRFLLSHDARVTYQWHRRALRYLQADRPKARWVLKAPMHSLYMDALLETYPDAMLIQTHRDPTQVIGSMCSLYQTLRQAWSDKADVTEQAEADAAFIAEYISCAVDYRHRHPDVKAQLIDVPFKAFMGDQMGVLEDIYSRFGLDFTDEARDAMATYLKSRPREKYGKHEYSLEQFGLTRERLAPLFSGYVQEHGELL